MCEKFPLISAKHFKHFPKPNYAELKRKQSQYRLERKNRKREDHIGIFIWNYAVRKRKIYFLNEILSNGENSRKWRKFIWERWKSVYKYKSLWGILGLKYISILLVDGRLIALSKIRACCKKIKGNVPKICSWFTPTLSFWFLDVIIVSRMWKPFLWTLPKYLENRLFLS